MALRAVRRVSPARLLRVSLLLPYSTPFVGSRDVAAASEHRTLRALQAALSADAWKRRILIGNFVARNFLLATELLRRVAVAAVVVCRFAGAVRSDGRR